MAENEVLVPFVVLKYLCVLLAIGEVKRLFDLVRYGLFLLLLARNDLLFLLVYDLIHFLSPLGALRLGCVSTELFVHLNLRQVRDIAVENIQTFYFWLASVLNGRKVLRLVRGQSVVSCTETE